MQKNHINWILTPSELRKFWIVGLINCIPAIGWAQSPEAKPASESTAGAEELTPLVVSAETMNDRIIQGPFLPEVVGTNIYAGKKTSVMDFDALPQIQTDNYRQAFAKTPGLLTSEVSNASLLSLSYRGIGDPHETQNMMVLKDGIPFVLDPLGYSTVYFAPPFESLDRLEFISGGAALLFGAQPSGALNYITHEPDRSSPFRATTQHILGSDNLYSTFSTVEGGNERFGYQLNYDHRSGDSFRSRNSDFELNGVDLSLYYDIDELQRITATFEVYEADHGEPGGRSVADNALNRNGTLLNSDRVRLDRTFGSIGYEFGDERTKWITKAWASDVVRYSKRQTGQGFGTVVGNQLDINQHTYNTMGLDSRLRLDYELAGQTSTFTAGITAMGIRAPIFTERTNPGDLTSDRGPNLRFDALRESKYGALFAENLFRFDRFTITPAVRLEYNEQKMDERVNVAKAGALIQDNRSETVPLGGLGFTYEATEKMEVYANVSTAYKPPAYTDAFPIGAADTVSANLDAGNVVNTELGYRGQPTSWSMFDASFFYIDYDNRFGRVGTNLQNVGRSINQGFSLTGEIDLYDLVYGESEISLLWYTAYQFLDAEFTGGPLSGRTPQYAPDHMLRTGLILQKEDSWKFAAMVTHLSDHWADDANTLVAGGADWGIPAYTVLDLTAEVKVWDGRVSGVDSKLWLLCGINNALDEQYFSRVRANGIDPANGVNYYFGMRAEF